MIAVINRKTSFVSFLKKIFLEWVKFFQLKYTMTNDRWADLVVCQKLFQHRKTKQFHRIGVNVIVMDASRNFLISVETLLLFTYQQLHRWQESGSERGNAAKGSRQELEPWCRFSDYRVSVHRTRAVTTELTDAWVQPWFDAEINPVCSE